MRSTVELSPYDPEYDNDAEELITPAIETTTASLRMEAVRDDETLLQNAKSFHEALNAELLRMEARFLQSSKRPPASVRSDLSNFRYVLEQTASKGWVSARTENKGAAILHVNCNWLQDIARSIVRNRPVEIEVADVDIPNPLSWQSDAPLSYGASLARQAPGFAIGAMVKRLAGSNYVRPVAVVHDIPRANSQFTVEAMRKVVIRQTYGTLREHGTILDSDQAGKDFSIVPLSRQLKTYDNFIEQLEAAENGLVARYTDGRMFLRPDDRIQQSVSHQFSNVGRNLATEGVLLQNADRTPSSAALQAATFLHPINQRFTHLRLHNVHLNDAVGIKAKPSVDAEQSISTILQTLDITHPDRDHNIYYDQTQGTNRITYAFAFLLRREVQKIIDYTESLNAVEDAMKPKDYFEHNYSSEEEMWPEDVQGSRALATELPLHYSPGEIESAAIIGYGPFSYPGLAIAPFMKEGGKIDISDLLQSNILFAEEWFTGTADEKHSGTYRNFANRLRQGPKSGRFFTDCEEQLRNAAILHVAALEDLPSDSAQVVLESFVSCSNNIEKYGFYETLRQKARIMTWTNRSMMISVHMVESGGWNNSGDHEGITIPAAKLTIEEIKDGYRSAGLRIVECTPLHADSGFREDYSGMVIIFAMPDTIDKPSSVLGS